jgi:hypothetical protein
MVDAFGVLYGKLDVLTLTILVLTTSAWFHTVIVQTYLRAAVHEFIIPAAIAAAAVATPAPAAGLPGTATAAAAAPAAPTGCNVLALAASDGLALQLSGWSYQYLMAMVYGNLMHHQNSFEPYVIPGPSKMQHTTFNPNVKFGPSAGQLPYFALTLSSCSIQVGAMSLRWSWHH